MAAIYIERRHAKGRLPGELAKDLGHHLYAQQLEGRALVILPKPFIFMRLVRKVWMRLLRVVETERARTLRAESIAVLSNQATRMKLLRFAASTPAIRPHAQVFFIDPLDIEAAGGDFQLIYVACNLDSAQLARVKSSLAPDGLLVQYE